MPVSLEARQNYFRILLDEKPTTQHKRIFYKDKAEPMGVYEVNMNYIVYNRHNGRLESEMQTWQTETGISDGEYTDEIHEKIKEFLWKTNPARNKRTLADIDEKGQLTPGIVTLDGVIIDGNRRAMILQKLGKQYFEAVILPDAYDENEREIVKLETQYQLGEDQKLDYGPLEKYLHAKRLAALKIEKEDAYKLMNLNSPSEFQKLLDIMKLMDDYLAHINCEGLYTMLRDKDGTKEGMFVDLYADLKKLESRNTRMVLWDYDEIDLLDLTAIQFDYIRFGGDFVGTGKHYRQISHSGSEKRECYFAHKDIWDTFSSKHRDEINAITINHETLDDYQRKHSEDFVSRTDAAKAWTEEWKRLVEGPIKENFGVSEDSLESKVGQIEPTRLLKRAVKALEDIDIDGPDLLSKPENEDLVRKINTLSYEMKRRFERAHRRY